MPELTAQPPRSEKSWRVFSIANECLHTIYLGTAFVFFFNRQFILPSEKSAISGRKRDCFYIVFGFSLIIFEFLSLLLLRQEGEVKEGAVYFSSGKADLS